MKGSQAGESRRVEGRRSAVVQFFVRGKSSRTAWLSPVHKSARVSGTRPQNNAKRYLDVNAGAEKGA